MRIAVVAARYGDPWSEVDVLTRRLAGALACCGDVDILLPVQGPAGTGHDGAVRILHFPASGIDLYRRAAWRQAVLGDGSSPASFSEAELGDLPDLVEQELLRSEGGESPELCAHLSATPYDLTVFVGVHAPVTAAGVKALADHRRFAVAPATVDARIVSLRLHDETFQRADRILVSTEFERSLIARRVGETGEKKIESVGFIIGVNPLGRTTEPPEFDGRSYLLVPGDWSGSPSISRFLQWAGALERYFGPDLCLRLVGPGADRLQLGIDRTHSRLDMWRWISRAFAVLEPRPLRLLGKEVLEAFLYSTPVIAHAGSGAAREHTELGNGGVWYRTDEELFASVEALLEGDLRRTLGEQGLAYARDLYGDTKAYIHRVQRIVNI
jgi:hypothetical protein